MMVRFRLTCSPMVPMAEFSSYDLGQQRDESGGHDLGRAEGLRSVRCILSASGRPGPERIVDEPAILQLVRFRAGASRSRARPPKL
jgi:hypothetical protein